MDSSPDWLTSVIEQLAEQARDQELIAAHHLEFIPEKLAVPGEVEAAIDAALHKGISIGFRRALDLLRPFAQP